MNLLINKMPSEGKRLEVYVVAYCKKVYGKNHTFITFFPKDVNYSIVFAASKKKLYNTDYISLRNCCAFKCEGKGKELYKYIEREFVTRWYNRFEYPEACTNVYILSMCSSRRNNIINSHHIA